MENSQNVGAAKRTARRKSRRRGGPREGEVEGNGRWAPMRTAKRAKGGKAGFKRNWSRAKSAV